MKKSLYMVATASMLAATSLAQNVVDAARYGASDIVGTARYRSMAGAFGALGGDPTCMSDNPAGIAIYRGTNLFTITPHLSFTSTTSAGADYSSGYDYQGSVKAKNHTSNVSVSNLAAIFSFKTPEYDNLVNFTLGIGFDRRYENFSKINTVRDNTSGSFGNYLTNQANNYLRGVSQPSASFDWSNEYTLAPFLSMMAYDVYAIVDNPDDKHAVMDPLAGSRTYQRLYTKENTRQDNYNISGSCNFNDMFYVGATLCVSDYSSTIISQFDEDYSYDYESGSYIAYDNNFETKGSGIGINLGVIYTPVDSWRVGLAMHTPMWSTYEENYDGSMITDDENVSDWSSYYDSWKYDFSTPWEYQVSTAYIFGTRGLLSVEYDLRDMTTMRYSANQQWGLTNDYFDDANAAIKDFLRRQHTWKVGAEYRVTDRLSARAGYAFITSPYTDGALYGNTDAVDVDLNDYTEDVRGNLPNLVYYSTTKPNFSTLGNQYYVTCGLGWRGSCWYADMSFMYHHSKYHVAAYPGDFSVCEPVDVSQGEKDWDLTIGYKF